jgi:hypothetical protein
MAHTAYPVCLTGTVSECSKKAKTAALGAATLQNLSNLYINDVYVKYSFVDVYGLELLDRTNQSKGLFTRPISERNFAVS